MIFSFVSTFQNTNFTILNIIIYKKILKLTVNFTNYFIKSFIFLLFSFSLIINRFFLIFSDIFYFIFDKYNFILYIIT